MDKDGREQEAGFGLRQERTDVKQLWQEYKTEQAAPQLLTKLRPGSERFHQLLREIGDLHDRKQRDYGTPADPFANVRASEKWGIPAWLGALIRLNDKVVRLQSYAKTGQMHNESAEDSLRDIAVYALISLVLLENTPRSLEGIRGSVSWDLGEGL